MMHTPSIMEGNKEGEQFPAGPGADAHPAPWPRNMEIGNILIAVNASTLLGSSGGRATFLAFVAPQRPHIKDGRGDGTVCMRPAAHFNNHDYLPPFFLRITNSSGGQGGTWLQNIGASQSLVLCPPKTPEGRGEMVCPAHVRQSPLMEWGAAN